MKTLDFFARHPVFSLAEATDALAPDGGRTSTLNRLKYHRSGIKEEKETVPIEAVYLRVLCGRVLSG
jgi:hypothetical protein